ncbi:MerR family transcriptional regulator [Loktanella sp. S4079]|uniref:MerR family transcriptional regulator n=1 Tax=Loktanella sp. S4079 TaxID=579483 RepID=UPI0005FA0A1A|nr:MerR family transcriptional regulator [Loktanella sp. S4079]KJZ20273.1 MerR family transcriptional regulator [Loktanella sp. S4079]
MAKAKDAFRTISEVAEWLDTPTHVLRFWESKFSQIKPVKGAGSRRYYRPSDMELLGGIKQLLHEDGMTIKGAQKLLREKGVKYVATLGKSVENPVEQAPASPQPAPEQIDAAPEPAPIQDALPFDDIRAPAADFLAGIPALPTEFPAHAARIVGIRIANPATLQARAGQIAPLLARLQQLRDQMQNQSR